MTDASLPVAERQRDAAAGAGSRLGAAAIRPFRRPIDWARRPWPDERIIMTAVTAATLVVTTFIVMQVVHFNPFDWLFGIGPEDLVFKDSTPTGGDMGAHVWAPAYLRDELLPNWQLSGWSMDWYGGLPVYRFYMVVPALAIVALDVVMPYGAAFKLVAISGVVAMPFCCWAFGRLARFRYPLPELFAFAGLCFVLNESYSIFGGNVMSTMAGEFSFSIAVAFMMLGLGFLCRGLDEGRFPVWAAVFLSLACLSHGIVLIYTMATALIIVICRCGADLWRVFARVVAGDAGTQDAETQHGGALRSNNLVYALLMVPAAIALTVLLAQFSSIFYFVTVAVVLAGAAVVALLCYQVGWSVLENKLFVKRLLYACLAGGLTLLLSAFWVGPFLFNHTFMTDMKYAPYPESAGPEHGSYWEMLFDQKPFFNVAINTLAVVGFLGAILRKHVYGVALGLATVASMAMVYVAHDSLPVIALLWNPRVLPWVYLMRYLLMMLGAFELGVLLINFVRNRTARELPGIGARSLIGAAGGLVVLLVFGWLYQWLPFGNKTVNADQSVQYRWGPANAPSPGGNDDWAASDGWAAYNFEGYENLSLYPELHDAVETMGDIGEEQGCGRTLWERTDNLYGTPMALMLLPYWTDGCIQSSEGLYFEASGTTPYHFITADAMSGNAYTPVRQIREVVNDAAVGVPYLQALGIEYLMVESPEAVAEADAQPELIPLATSGRWHIYEVEDSTIVEPLTVEPVVVNGRSGDARECFLELGTSWFQNRGDWAALPATGGPDDWQRIDVAIDETMMQPAGQDPDNCGDPESDPGRLVHVVRPVQEIEARELEPVEVSNVEIEQQSVEFDVDRIGVPVLVRVSYFPNWKVSGADGPYRVAPNFMVVVPTDKHVKLEYGRSTTDYGFYGLTVIGIAAAVVTRIRGPVRYPKLPGGSGSNGQGGPEGDDDDAQFAAVLADVDRRLSAVSGTPPAALESGDRGFAAPAPPASLPPAPGATPFAPPPTPGLGAGPGADSSAGAGEPDGARADDTPPGTSAGIDEQPR